jgi:hypothetical protein
VAPYLLLTTALPRHPSEGESGLRAAGPEAVFDVVDLCAPEGLERLARYAKGGQKETPLSGFWR